MRQHIRIGVPERTAFVRNENAAQNERTPFDQTVSVETVPEALRRRRSEGTHKAFMRKSISARC